ncbi:MAG: polysaccharide biosynthesis protein [Lachnospiraceae bacterium]|nr:polysaccharide biosynthesis protein [Lachnospiraceae bacterium]
MERVRDKKIFSQIRWLLFLYDLIVWIVISSALIILHPSQTEYVELSTGIIWIITGAVCIFLPRFLLRVYTQIWRYGGTVAHLRMILADVIGGLAFIALVAFTPFTGIRIILAACIICMNLLVDITMRMVYYVVYRLASGQGRWAKICARILHFAAGMRVRPDTHDSLEKNRAKLPAAIVGAGRVGVMLAQELNANPNSGYIPVCFIENDYMKVGRCINDIPIIYESEDIADKIKAYEVQIVILALPEASAEVKKHIYDIFKDAGVRLLTYDYPLAATSDDGHRQLRQFSIEELLARKPVAMDDKKVAAYYRGKVVMITGGGGSIGSELCRQVLMLDPRRVVIADIAENSTYELQMDLRMKYGAEVPLEVEICDVTNMDALRRVYETYRPQIVLHAAAHKHVPLMEHNSVECVRNNVFGTLNAVELAKEYGCEHFIMISTDKAVNPTNIMGASKRMCELIVGDAARDPECGTVFTATRFGNVLGSAGSVVPLFRKQIDHGGPITVTHRDIIRFFMTIPEATQLVLTSGAIARNGELFVLDMGKPVKIYDMAENMIRLSGMTPGVDIEIVETGLRPGEKLYEELLIDPDKQEKTENELIYIERDEGIGSEALAAGLDALRAAVADGDDDAIKDVMAQVVPTYRPKR